VARYGTAGGSGSQEVLSQTNALGMTTVLEVVNSGCKHLITTANLSALICRFTTVAHSSHIRATTLPLD
jgi:hypothetical protein